MLEVESIREAVDPAGLLSRTVKMTFHRRAVLMISIHFRFGNFPHCCEVVPVRYCCL